jgi:hypothetical protein
MGTIQQTIGSQPIVNLDPPPEGTMASGLTFTLTPGQPNAATNLQLSSQAGLMMSQVLTLVIDNSQNLYPIVVVHGAFNEKVTAPAGATLIVPTFSNKNTYPINVSVANNITPLSNINVNIIFCNYQRQAGSFGNTGQSSIIGTGLNTGTLASQSVIITGTGTYVIGIWPTPNYILDSLDLTFGGCTPSAGGLYEIQFAVTTDKTTPGLDIETFNLFGEGPSGTLIPGPMVGSPISRTWPVGYLCPRGGQLQLDVGTFNGLTNFVVNVNISGVTTA